MNTDTASTESSTADTASRRPLGAPSTAAIIDSLTALLGPDGEQIRSHATVIGGDPLTPSPHRLADATSAAIAAFGIQVAAVAESAGADPQTITVRAADAIDQLRASYLTTVSGVPAPHLIEDPRALGNNDFYRCRDDRWIFLITTYAGLRDAVCKVLNCPPFPDRIAEAAAHWDAVALETAVCAAGGVAAIVRTAEQWRAHEVGIDLLARDIVEIDRIGDGPQTDLPAAASWPPLGGVRVTDLTHVIAGPVSTRLLATFGADVLHVSRPDNSDPNAMVVMTGGGKRNAFADLRDDHQRAAFSEVCAGSDVIVNSYRGITERGFGAHDLAALRPGVVVCEYHCWGADGPWAERGGFDQLACSATGFAGSEAVNGRPSLPPTYLLNDYLAAYLGAAGMVAALRRRAAVGGSWRVRINLARVCMWVQDLGLFARDVVDDIPRPSAPTIGLQTVGSPFGIITEPGLPLSFDGVPTPVPGAPSPLGSSPLRW
ncbi:cag pathogenicity island protein [Williamsia sp. Leaf354]|uniref:CoA transferase n=1 Tax=Williamsia sp. Leaf354 TaxID=1736349 RepID=UPI0006F74799|nr:CoA transferase [Williamsia sp. Leaf354]KQS00922.1 cag pathogenicity island protein [Williamsia sp. Leaf354]